MPGHRRDNVLPALVPLGDNGLMAMTMDDLRRRRIEITRIAAARGAHNVRVFGSVARGDATDLSDVDFLVDFEDGRDVGDLSELILDLQEALGCDVDVKWITEPSRTADTVLRQAVAL